MWLLVCLVVVLSFSFRPSDNKKGKTIFDDTGDPWVEKILKGMSVEEKAGQLVFPSMDSQDAIPGSREYNRYIHYVKDLKIGGAIFFIGSMHEQAILTNKLQELSKIPLLISSDFERGVSQYNSEGTLFPTNMAIGAADDSALTYQMGYIIAQEGLSFGVHQNFAPVADVNSNPLNPIINVRSYGEDVKLVSKLSNAFIRGTQDGGMIAVSKHFPGHGNTSVDSHKKLPLISSSKNDLDKVEFAPFISNINTGVLSCMVSHLALSAYEPNTSLPASLSNKVITGLLRNQLGFSGLVVTDALNMKAITNNYSDAEAAVLAVQAGNDCLLFPNNPDAYVEAIVNAVKTGKITEERLNISVRKILLAKKWAGLDKGKAIDVNNIGKTVGIESHWNVAKKLAEKSITLVKNSDGLIPFNPAKKYLQVNIMDTRGGNSDEYFNSLISRKMPQAGLERVFTNTSSKEYGKIVERAKLYDAVILNVYLKVRSSQGTINLEPQQKSFINNLMSSGKKVVLVSHGNPYILSDFPQAGTYLCNYGDAKVSEEALVKAFWGEINIQGKLPVSIPNTGYKAGCGIKLSSVDYNKALRKKDSVKSIGLNSGSLQDIEVKNVFASTELSGNEIFMQTIPDKNKFKEVDKVVEEGIKNKAFPGAVVLVEQDGKILLNKAYGNYTYEKNSRPMEKNTIFDLASVSKVIATTTASMICYDRKLFSLDDKVTKYFPEFGVNGKDKITILNLLLHNAGLPPFKNFYNPLLSKEEVFKDICASKINYPVGSKMEYSDLGMITVGKIIEKVTGKTLDAFCRDEIFKPLGMHNTMYNPPAKLKDKCAPTEFDDYFRKRQLQGEVHDEAASVLGGVAGHAGLFSTTEDLSKLLQMILNRGIYKGKRYIKESTVALFTTKYSEQSTRGLGWDTKSPSGSSAGNLMGPRSYGHTGYTGTCVWTDPDKKLIVVFLTNRVYPTRNNSKIGEVRPKLHDAVVKALE
jgi:beta-glucosidase-like glycosyl hydrolase/CubicO group peptidase (beta-lactamase class C family)